MATKVYKIIMFSPASKIIVHLKVCIPVVFLSKLYVSVKFI